MLAAPLAAEEQTFAEVLDLICASREQALGAVNTALIDLYWRVGELVARKIRTEGWGKGTVATLSAYVQIDGALFERAVLNPPKVSTALREVHPAAETIFRDAYCVEFLNLPIGYHETDLHTALLQNMRRFLAELGRDFCFIGSEVALQVGGRDFELDLLFFHRELACLVALELKVGELRPEPCRLSDAYCGVPDPPAGQAATSGQAARILRTNGIDNARRCRPPATEIPSEQSVRGQ